MQLFIQQLIRGVNWYSSVYSLVCLFVYMFVCLFVRSFVSLLVYWAVMQSLIQQLIMGTLWSLCHLIPKLMWSCTATANLSEEDSLSDSKMNG